MATTPKKSAAKTAAASNEASFVKELADILDQAGLAELEYETEAVAIRLSRVTAAAPVAAAPVLLRLLPPPRLLPLPSLWQNCRQIQPIIPVPSNRQWLERSIQPLNLMRLPLSPKAQPLPPVKPCSSSKQ